VSHHIDIEPACAPPPHETGLEALEAEQVMQDKCELLAEEVVSFFDAMRQLLQDYLAQLSQPPPAPLATLPPRPPAARPRLRG
jgi:hypothetical protein